MLFNRRFYQDWAYGSGAFFAGQLWCRGDYGWAVVAAFVPYTLVVIVQEIVFPSPPTRKDG